MLSHKYNCLLQAYVIKVIFFNYNVAKRVGQIASLSNELELSSNYFAGQGDLYKDATMARWS
jgi:hypothetical protein